MVNIIIYIKYTIAKLLKQMRIDSRNLNKQRMQFAARVIQTVVVVDNAELIVVVIVVLAGVDVVIGIIRISRVEVLVLHPSVTENVNV